MSTAKNTLVSLAVSSSSLYKCSRWRRRLCCAPSQGLPLPPCLSNLSVTAEAPSGFFFFSLKASRRVGVNDDVKRDDENCAADLEDELYDFMMKSANPRRFPSKKDLIAAGRMDLVQAILNHGGWLSLGWDLEALDSSGAVEMEVQKQKQKWTEDDQLHVVVVVVGGARASSSSDMSSSGRLREMGNRDVLDSGIERMLSRLEKESSISFGFTRARKGGNGQADVPCKGDDFWRLASTVKKFGRYMLLDSGEDLCYHGVEGEIPSCCEELIVYDLGDKIKNSANVFSRKYLRIASDEYKNQIQLRLQRLESKLKSSLSILRSKNALFPPESQLRSSKQSPKLSDDLEFQETEVIKAWNKLRSLRARLSVLERKMALNTSEAQAILSEKQKRIDAAKKAQDFLHTVCIVWHTMASEVLLCGSFDGWTNQEQSFKGKTQTQRNKASKGIQRERWRDQVLACFLYL